MINIYFIDVHLRLQNFWNHHHCCYLHLRNMNLLNFLMSRCMKDCYSDCFLNNLRIWNKLNYFLKNKHLLKYLYFEWTKSLSYSWIEMNNCLCC